jgi:hypothetical protein
MRGQSLDSDSFLMIPFILIQAHWHVLLVEFWASHVWQ